MEEPLLIACTVVALFVASFITCVSVMSNYTMLRSFLTNVTVAERQDAESLGLTAGRNIYDLGIWRNLQQVFRSRVRGDGISWPTNSSDDAAIIINKKND